MEFQKISSPSLRELFVNQFEELILSGKLKIGEKLPPEGHHRHTFSYYELPGRQAKEQ